jgi:hypothetical protein
MFPIPSLDDTVFEEDELFTTGDTYLDQLLDGGIRTGMLWEIVGERSVRVNDTVYRSGMLLVVYFCC